MLTFKGDHNINTSHRLSGMVNRNFRTRYNSGTPRWGVPPGSPTGVYQNQDTPGTMVRMAYDFVLSPTFLGRGNLGYNRFGNMNESVYVDQDWPQKIGLQNVPGVHFPVLTISGQPFQGGAIGARNHRGVSVQAIAEAASTDRRSDSSTSLTFAASTTSSSASRIGATTTTPATSPDPAISLSRRTRPRRRASSIRQDTVSPVSCSAITARPPAASLPPTSATAGASAGFYFQDDWKVNRKLTLNLGLRWEMVGGLIEVAGRMSAIDFDLANPGAGNRPGALAFADDLGRGGFQDTYWKQISPKFGFAYALTDKMVLRGGYGINNTPAISNGFGFGGTLGYNGNINVTSANTPIRFAEDPLGNLDQPYPDFTGTLPNKSPSLPTVKTSTTTQRRVTDCRTSRTGTSAFSTSCRGRWFSKATTSPTRVRDLSRRASISRTICRSVSRNSTAICFRDPGPPPARSRLRMPASTERTYRRYDRSRSSRESTTFSRTSEHRRTSPYRCNSRGTSRTASRFSALTRGRRALV